jgi:hypothetical protein
LGTQKVAGKLFDGIEFFEACCRSFVNYEIVKFVGSQDNVIFWVEYLCYPKNFLVTKCFGFSDQPARQTGEKHILSNINACCKISNGVSYTSNWRSMTIHARFINFHVRSQVCPRHGATPSAGLRQQIGYDKRTFGQSGVDQVLVGST